MTVTTSIILCGWPWNRQTPSNDMGYHITQGNWDVSLKCILLKKGIQCAEHDCFHMTPNGYNFYDKYFLEKHMHMRHELFILQRFNVWPKYFLEIFVADVAVNVLLKAWEFCCLEKRIQVCQFKIRSMLNLLLPKYYGDAMFIIPWSLLCIISVK